MTDIETQGYEQIKEHVRTQLSWRAEQALKDMDKMFVDDPGTRTAGMMSAYAAMLKTYGSFWRVTDKPEDQRDLIPAATVARMLQEARIEAAAEAVEVERARVALESQRALESADSELRRRLDSLRNRELPGS